MGINFKKCMNEYRMIIYSGFVFHNLTESVGYITLINNWNALDDTSLV